jgi:hypothetical protein
MFLAPAFALGMWNPFLAGALRGSAQASEEFGTLASEWQEFVGRRLKEDFGLMQRLAHSRPLDPQGRPLDQLDQVLATYTEFWNKAAEDYGKEVTAMTKLMAAATAKMVVATQSAVEEAGTNVFQSPRSS